MTQIQKHLIEVLYNYAAALFASAASSVYISEALQSSQPSGELTGVKVTKCRFSRLSSSNVGFEAFFFPECLGSVDEAPAEEISGRGECNLWSYNSLSCLAELPSSVGPRNTQETHTHAHFLVFVTQSLLSLSLSLAPAWLFQMCLRVLSFSL